MKLLIGLGVLALTLAGLAPFSGAQTAPANWGPLRFLLGEWVGEGSSEVGQGTGGTSFTLDLQNRVIVRKNRAEYPATKDRPAYVHDDLMIIYQDSEKGPFKAIFFDSEGHVINYVVQVASDENSIQFLSAASSSSPGFRLTYAKRGPDKVGLKFEVAPPGKPDSFSTFITAEIRRKN